MTNRSFMKSCLTLFISILLSAVALVGLVVILNEASSHSERDGKGQTIKQLQSEVMSKSIGFYVGRDLTDDNSTLLGGFGHEPSSHWIDIVPAQEHPEGAMVKVGVTEEARFKGKLIEEGNRQEARALISEQTQNFLLQSLNLGMWLTDEIEQATRQDHGLSIPEKKPEEGETTPPSSQSMNARSGDDYIHCYIPGLTDFPRSHGSFIE